MPDQLSPIEAQQRTVGKVFDDSYAFEIPAYQRPYAWEIDQAKELLDDLVDAMEDKQISGGMYFLGSIVLIKLPNDPRSRVIDGQQRLTTLTILLSALRDLTTDNEKRLDRRRYIFQKANPDLGTEDRFRVLLRVRDRAFFHKCVQEPGATNTLPDVEALEGSQYRIAANARYFREQLEQMDESRRDALVAFIIQHCYLVVVAVPTAEAARRIFTVLNARGLDLTPTDILKADLLDRTGNANEAALADRWESVEQETGRDGMVELFGHIRMIYEREKPRSALEVGFPKAVPPFNEDGQKFISGILEPVADAFVLLKDNSAIQKQFGTIAAKSVRSLMRIDNKDWLPPALLRLWLRKPDDNVVIADFLVRLERTAYFLFVNRYGVNERIARFALIMNDIDPRGAEHSTSGLDLTDLEQAEFIESLDGKIYQNSRVCKPVLQRLDEGLSTGGATYDELVSIEHVLPQTVSQGSEWEKLYPDESVRSEWTHKLANLVFLTHRVNTRASNWSFLRKKKEYFASKDGASPFVITQDVLRTDEWTLDHLVDRQTRLLAKLADIWELNLEKLGGEGTSDLRVNSKDGKSATDANQIAAKRQQIMQALSHREGKELFRKSEALSQNLDNTLRAACAISKHYSSGAPYWYGYSLPWDKFLSEAETAFLVLGCLDRDCAYAIPYTRIKQLLPHLHKTPERHWHVVLDENGEGKLDLSVPKTGSRIGLAEYELKLNS